MKLRFEDRFTFRVEMDEEILSCCMPRFLLQPLVENAVFHGLEPKQGPGLLELKGTLLDGNNIQFTCSDNGIGMNSEKLITLQKQLETIGKQEHPAIKIKQNVGLYNVHLTGFPSTAVCKKAPSPALFFPLHRSKVWIHINALSRKIEKAIPFLSFSFSFC